MIDVTVVDEVGRPLANAEVRGTNLAAKNRHIINRLPGGTNKSGHIRLGGFPVAETNYLKGG